MALRPLGDRIVLRKEVAADTTPGGIALPDGVKEKPQYAFVVACGPDSTRLNGGEKVLFPKYSGTEVHHDGEDLLVMGEKDILAIVE